MQIGYIKKKYTPSCFLKVKAERNLTAAQFQVKSQNSASFIEPKSHWDCMYDRQEQILTKITKREQIPPKLLQN